jgi:hypothetical protein
VAVSGSVAAVRGAGSSTATWQASSVVAFSMTARKRRANRMSHEGDVASSKNAMS